MRWRAPQYGDIRIREGFLWFPLGKIYFRWLEWAKWEEERFGGDWNFTKWLDNE